MAGEAAANAVSKGAGLLGKVMKMAFPMLAVAGILVIMGATMGGGSAAFAAAAQTGTTPGVSDVGLTALEGLTEGSTMLANATSSAAAWLGGVTGGGAAGSTLAAPAITTV